MEALHEHGYAVLRGAVTQDTLDAYARERTQAHDGLLVRRDPDGPVELASQAPDDAAAIDPYALVDAARSLLLSPAVLALFDEPPLLFDATETSGRGGDDRPRYRDATHTALASRPETLVTVAVALHDGVSLTVRPGSATIATTPFSGRHRAHNPERDGAEALDRHHAELDAALADAPPAETITLNPGDAIAWTADLVHGPIAGPALVAHVCPASVDPAWFTYRPERALRARAAGGAAWVASQHYDLVDALEPEDDPAGVSTAAEAARVEAPTPAQPQQQTPQPASPRRPSGGLVDSVRGILGRRGRR